MRRRGHACWLRAWKAEWRRVTSGWKACCRSSGCLRCLAVRRRGRPLVVLSAQEHVHGGHYEQGEEGADRYAGEDHQSHVVAPNRACTTGDEQRDHAECHRGRGHQNGAQADGGSCLYRITLGFALALLL